MHKDQAAQRLGKSVARPASAFELTAAVRESQLQRQLHVASSGTLGLQAPHEYHEQTCGTSAVLTNAFNTSQSPTRKPVLSPGKVAESTCSKNNPQSEALRYFFTSHLNLSQLMGDARVQQTLTQANKLFEDIYIYNRKISASGVRVE